MRIVILSTTAALSCTLPLPSISAESVKPLASNIYCKDLLGGLATVVRTKSGKQVPIIYWKSVAFDSSGWDAPRRCKEVSKRFLNYYQSGMLNYITTGRMNGLPVICVAKTNGGGCAGLLYTLKPRQNATATLQKLLDIQTKPGAAPLEETTARLYVNFDSMVLDKAGAGVGSSIVKPATNPTAPHDSERLF